jgi:hypothetical protein
VPDVFDPDLWRGLANTAVGPTSRLFALYILSAAAMAYVSAAAMAYVVYRLSERRSSKGFWAFLVPPSIYPGFPM